MIFVIANLVLTPFLMIKINEMSFDVISILLFCTTRLYYYLHSDAISYLHRRGHGDQEL